MKIRDKNIGAFSGFILAYVYVGSSKNVRSQLSQKDAI
jgi:hypothetical protein